MDVVRGLAVLCMVVDHVTLILGGPEALRLTIGRVAMPLFFVTAGYCAGRSGRLRVRHLEVALVGLLLPLVVPWIDAPNVLVWWAWGCALLAGLRYAGLSPAVLAVVCAGVLANGYSGEWAHSYDPYALWALMALGALLPSSWANWTRTVPARGALSWLGRHALPVYVFHALALTGLAALL